jgi:hypothetical protein
LSTLNTRPVPLWGALPRVLQWILFIPVVIALYLLCGYSLNLILSIFGSSNDVFFFAKTAFQTGVTCILLIFLAFKLAPSKPFVCAVAFYAVFSLPMLVHLRKSIDLFIYSSVISFDRWVYVSPIQAATWLIVGAFALVYVGKRMKKKNLSEMASE